jgi:hypothetical protein
MTDTHLTPSHQVALTNNGIQDVLDVVRNSVPAGVGITVTLMVSVGGPTAPDANGDGKHGQIYYAVAGDLRYEYGRRGLVLQIPESIAEALRQQGRREAQRDMRSAIGA